MKAVVAAFNQEKALVGAFSVITNLRMELFEALVDTTPEVVRVLPLVHAAVHRGEEVAGVLGVAVRPLVHVHLHGAVNVVTLAYLDTVRGKDMKFPKQEV